LLEAAESVVDAVTPEALEEARERERKEEARDAKAARGPKWFRKRRG
jgi:hypothetical protein